VCKGVCFHLPHDIAAMCLYRNFTDTLHLFDAPGAGTGNFQGTVPIGITPGGLVAGVYVDPKDGNYGFLFRKRAEFPY
jgi:hypothetical protein